MNFDDRMAVKMFALVQGGDTVWTSKWAPTSQRNILPASSQGSRVITTQDHHGHLTSQSTFMDIRKRRNADTQILIVQASKHISFF
jgi:hypothetical protein